MSEARFPAIDERRAAEFTAELRARAKAWIPAWDFEQGRGDFGGALLDILARFSSEVTETLDGTGDRLRRGLLDWLGVRGKAARAARVPIVFQTSATTTDAMDAIAPIRVQAEVAGTPVVFESERDFRIVPGKVEVVVAVDLRADAYYLSPPGLVSLEPLRNGPTRWQVKGFAPAGSTKLQLDPDLGLAKGMVIQAAGFQYQVVESENGLVTIDRPLELELASVEDVVTEVTAFDPFGGAADNAQEHALYIGDTDLLNIEAPATIGLVVAGGSVSDVDWQYWGKENPDGEAGWLPLKQDRDRPGIVLQMPRGKIETREVNHQSGHWIRGVKRPADAGEPFRTESVKIRINCPDDGAASKGAADGPTVEAMANTTPLVLSETFYPLGREPRQFDAFYIGCEEAFSKKDAKVTLRLQMADASFVTYAVRPGLRDDALLAGIGKDNALYLFTLSSGILKWLRGPLRPPQNPQQVNLNANCRPVICGVNGTDFGVAVASGRTIWIWHESANATATSGWQPRETLPALPDTEAAITDLLVRQSVPDRPTAALSGGLLFLFANNTWRQPSSANSRPRYATLVPAQYATGAATDAMIAVSTDGDVFHLDADGTPSTQAGIKFGTVIRPVARERNGKLQVAGASTDGRKLVYVERTAQSQWQGSKNEVLPDAASAIGAEVVVAEITRTVDGIQESIDEFAVGAMTPDNRVLVASWLPGETIEMLESTVTDAAIPLGGTPVIAVDRMVVPGGRGDAFIARFEKSKRIELTSKTVFDVVILPDAPEPLAPGDFLSVITNQAGNPRKGWTLANDAPSRPSERLSRVDPTAKPVAADPQVIAYRASSAGTGTSQDDTTFTPDAANHPIVPGMILRVTSASASPPTRFCEVMSATPTEVKVHPLEPLPTPPGQLEYHLPITPAARVASGITFTRPTDGHWEAPTFQGARIYVRDTATFGPLPLLAFTVPDPGEITLAFPRLPTPAPTSPVHVVIDNVIGPWSQQFADASSNPALSWEYWNGKGWWSLDTLVDGTNKLATTGEVTFTVPADIDKTDWSGRTNFWIRARLVGGDYGREEVAVTDTPRPNSNVVDHTVHRSTDNIRAPQVMTLAVNYEICAASYPAFVGVEDSGTFRDLSEANRTDGAIVEAFVPLRETLRRLSTPDAAGGTDAGAASACGCARPARTAALSPESEPGTAEARQAILIGLTAPPSGGPVQILMLVDEQDYSAFAPLTVDALIAGKFVPIAADDASRALGESGLVQLSFAMPPTPAELFGRPLNWLRLRPKPGVDGDWKPKLRGVYLNAVWASSTETLTRELLGSSNGAPHQTLRLARPPVLYGTLELRVREPLGDEERAALRRDGAGAVKSAEAELPGDWVLWKQVVDPLDAPPLARVYALDEESGEIHFGDGLHGMIPPTGRDCIVAFRYQRTAPGAPGAGSVPGNTIAARAALSLVSPLEGVDAVIAADQSAGGAPPESDARVLRFGGARVRHRDRAITAADLEQIALQSSPDIVQARARVVGRGARVLVVMRGPQPRPSAAQTRELRRLLLAALPPSFNRPNALRVESPDVRYLRLALPLRIETLEHAVTVTDAVERRLRAYFDTATGGPTGDGWPLGAGPTADDVSLALVDAPRLLGIGDVRLIEVAADQGEREWPVTLGPAALAALAADPFRIQFETAEVTSSQT